MSRTHRLFDLLQMLRRHRRPVSGAELAREAGISLRTLYRDIASLQAMGAGIDGEPGVGYVLRPGFLLPPLMFSTEEIEALALGARWVASRTDDGLSGAARNAMAKIAAVLPDDLQRRLDSDALLIGPPPLPLRAVDLTLLRQALREERKLALVYRDEKGTKSERVVWPVALGFFEISRVLVGWCELRGAFRHFRADRIEAATLLATHPPRRRQALVRDWRQTMLTESGSRQPYAAPSSEPSKESIMSMEITLYTNPMSRGNIVHWLLEELAVPYTVQVLEYGTSMKAPEYLAINPMGKVPAIRHGDQVVTEAAAICAYLADAFPAAGLLPKPQDRGAYYRWLFFAAACVEPAISNHATGWDPATPDQQRSFGYGSYKAAVDSLAGAVAGRRYVAGDSFSAADVYIGSLINWATRFGVLEKRPEFEAYWDGLKDRPAYLRARAQCDKMLVGHGLAKA